MAMHLTQPFLNLVIARPAMNDADENVALVAAIRRGEPEAAKALWVRHCAMVRRVLVRILGPHIDVEDLLQETFLAVFERIGTLREPAALRAFVLSIAVFTARYEIRRRKRRSWLSFSPDIESMGASIEPHEDREALQHFYVILGTLNDVDRAAFVLRFVEHCELTEVADALDVSLATVKRHLDRAWERVTLLASRDPLLQKYLSPRQP
jgi:RNA polymerase sigma-70 factor (ECF subfamily)